MTPAHLRTPAVTAPLRGSTYAPCVWTELTTAGIEGPPGPLRGYMLFSN